MPNFLQAVNYTLYSHGEFVNGLIFTIFLFLCLIMGLCFVAGADRFRIEPRASKIAILVGVLIIPIVGLMFATSATPDSFSHPSYWAQQTTENTFAGKKVQAQHIRSKIVTIPKEKIVSIDYKNFQDGSLKLTKISGNGTFQKMTIAVPFKFKIANKTMSPRIVLNQEQYLMNNTKSSQYYTNQISGEVVKQTKPKDKILITETTQATIYLSKDEYTKNIGD